MLKLRPTATIIFLSTAIGLLAASCADTRYSQCKQIIQISIQVKGEIEKLCQDCESENSQEALQVADVMESSAAKMAAIEVDYEELQGYQGGFVELYQGWSQATRDFVEALNQKDIKAAQLAKEKLQQFGSKEKEIVDGINNYCNSN